MSVPLLSVIVPVFNESQVIGAFYDRATGALAAIPGVTYELIFVDDGSSDATLAVKGDAVGGAFQSFAVCGVGQLPSAGGCVEVVKLDGTGAGAFPIAISPSICSRRPVPKSSAGVWPKGATRSCTAPPTSRWRWWRSPRSTP